jgi:hypothetical protein
MAHGLCRASIAVGDSGFIRQGSSFTPLTQWSQRLMRRQNAGDQPMTVPDFSCAPELSASCHRDRFSIGFCVKKLDCRNDGVRLEIAKAIKLQTV